MSANPQSATFQMPAPPAEHAATQKVADRLVEMLNAGQNMEAIRDLYAEDAKHIEVMDAPWCPRITSGKKGVLERAEQFARSTKVHSASHGRPLVNGEQFVLPMSIDCTANEGPMAGQRMNMTETALYTVRNGKISEVKFFYGCGV